MTGWRCARCNFVGVIGWGGERYLPSLHYWTHHRKELTR